MNTKKTKVSPCNRGMVYELFVTTKEGRELYDYQLATLAPAPTPAHADVPFDAWILNTNGKDHHGDAFSADGGASACSSCHWEDWRKQPSYDDIRSSRLVLQVPQRPPRLRRGIRRPEPLMAGVGAAHAESSTRPEILRGAVDRQGGEDA